MPGHRSKSAARDELARLGIPPRVLDLDLAAAYVGLSAEAFLAAVAAGTYPKALTDGRRRQWDRAALDAAVDRRSRLRPKSAGGESEEEIMGAIDAAE